LIGSSALAQSREDQARNLEKAGEALFMAGKFREAIERFRDVVQRFEGPPEVLNAARWNIARCHEELGEDEAALAAFEEFARWARTDDEKRDAAAKIEALRLRVRATVRFTVQPDGAEVQVDGARVGTAPLQSPLVLDPGRHVVSVSMPGYRPYEETIVLRSKEARDISVSLKLMEGEITVSTRGGKADTAVVSVDGSEVYRGSLPARIRVPAGERKVVVTMRGLVEHLEQVVSVPDGGNVPVTLVITPPKTPPMPAESPVAPPSRTPPPAIVATPAEEPALAAQASLSVGEGFVHDSGQTARTHANVEALAGMRFRAVRWFQIEMALTASVESPVMALLRPGLRLYVGDIPIFFRLAGQAMLTPARMGGLLFGMGGEIPLGLGFSLPLEADANLWPSAVHIVPVEFRAGVAYAF